MGNEKIMRGAVLPGTSTVEFTEFEVPEPGPRQVLIEMKASSICGSDIRAIYREHLGKGPEAYQGVVAGHEPCGRIVKLGPGCRVRREGERVTVYHISGCGCCEDCMDGYQISCRSEIRAAYGWQRNGGHAPFLLAEEQDCIALPDELTYVDGAFLACGYGTVWECLTRMRLSGRDRLLITGLGPVGLAAAQLGKALGAAQVIGVEIDEQRLDFAGNLEFDDDVPLVDHTLASDEEALDKVLRLTDGRGCEVSIDCSGAASARLLALRGTRQWGRCGYVGEGGKVEFDVSQHLIHPQITLYGSWVTSRRHLADLAGFLASKRLHPDITSGPQFPLREAAQAYEIADRGHTGKVSIVFE